MTASELITQLQGMIEKQEITPDANVMLQGPGQDASTMGVLTWLAPRIPLLAGGIPNGIILVSERPPLFGRDAEREVELVGEPEVQKTSRVPEGYALIPKNVSPAMGAIYTNEGCVYQTAQELHDALLTCVSHEWVRGLK